MSLIRLHSAVRRRWAWDGLFDCLIVLIGFTFFPLRVYMFVSYIIDLVVLYVLRDFLGLLPLSYR